MGNEVLAGQALVATTAPGGLNQYYGYADGTVTTISTAAALAPLSSVYTIPAGEAYAGAAYRLSCGGSGTWGATAGELEFQWVVGSALGDKPTVAAAALQASAGFDWSLDLEIVCVDGINTWHARSAGGVVVNTQAANPGNAASNAVALATSALHTQSASSPVAVYVNGAWMTNAGSIYCAITTFRKIA